MCISCFFTPMCRRAWVDRANFGQCSWGIEAKRPGPSRLRPVGDCFPQRVRGLPRYILIAQRVGADPSVCPHNPPPATRGACPPPPAGDTRPGTVVAAKHTSLLRQRGTQEPEPAHAALGLIFDPSSCLGATRARTGEIEMRRSCPPRAGLSRVPTRTSALPGYLSSAGGTEPCADEDVGAPRVLILRGRG